MLVFNKRWLIVLMICLLVIMCFFIAFPNMCEPQIKKKILSYVKENKDILDDYAQNKKDDIVVVLEGHPVKVSYIDEYVDFFCGGFGIGPDGMYYGFYISPNDIPMNIAFHQPLKKTKSGYRWEQESGNCYFYTEKIVMNYYYYEYES